MPARDAGPGAADTVEDYLARLPEPERNTLARLRGQIRNAAPLVPDPHVPPERAARALRGSTQSLSLTVVSLEVLERFRGELSGFDVSGRTIHFTPTKPLPAGLVKRIVQARVRENEAAARARRLAGLIRLGRLRETA